MDGTAIHSASTAVLSAFDLRKVMAQIFPVIDRRQTIPVLAMVMVEVARDKITLTASDLDIWIKVSAEAEIEGDGARMIHAATLLAFAKAATGRVRISFNADETTTLADDAMTMRLRDRIPTEDFPMPPFMDSIAEVPAIEMAPADLARLFDLTRRFISTDQMRFYLNGVHLCQRPDGKTLRAVATDGHKMAVIDSAVEAAPPAAHCIVPTKTVDAMRRALGAGQENVPALLRLIDTKASLEVGDVQIWSKTIEGTYPDYMRAIQAAEAKLTVHLDAAMLARLNAAPAGANRSGRFTRPVRFDLAEGVATVKGDEVEVSVPLVGETRNPDDTPFPFAMNLDLLREMARTAGSFSASGPNASDHFTIHSDDPDAFWVIMPMRLQ